MPGNHAYNLGLAYGEVARRQGSLTALRYPSGAETTHRDLDRRSNRIARVLQEMGVGQGQVVCIFSSKSPDAYATMLACLKIGAPYCNLDTTSPKARIEKMIGTCAPALIVHDVHAIDQQHAARGISEVQQVALLGDEFQARAQAASAEDLDETLLVTGTNPAYIMFTSGSTGMPKGAVMTHANVLNFIAWGRATLDVTPADTFTNVNPIYFDNSVFDFYVSLFNGATMCPVDADTARKPRDLVRAVEAARCTIWFSVPSMLVYLLTTRALTADDLPLFRAFVFGGEGFPKPKLKALFDLYGSRSRLVNVYGPTECTCICSSYDITAADVADLTELAPLGYIAPNFGYLIDPVEEDDPEFGELLLSGPNVGLGYYRDQERTATSFVQIPSHERYGERVYRTGDLVHRAPNGHLHFKGRVDNQIKHMGYRIELEEIEAAFATLDYVDEVAVVYRRESDGLGQISAHVGASTDRTEKAILEDIKRIVPPYMVPRTVSVQPVLPKNRNGKIDRKALKDLQP